MAAKENIKRHSKAFVRAKDQRNYYLMLGVLLILAVSFVYGLLVYKNPVPVTSSSFIPVVKRRVTALLTMFIVATCQSLSTISFQSVTNNRIITPSLLGFEAIYSTIHTVTMYFFGVRAFLDFTGLGPFLLQIGLMIIVCLALYGYFLTGSYQDLQLMLLVGVIIGSGLRFFSAFLRRLMSPSEFDILQAKLFGSVNNADASYFPVAIPLVLITVILLLAQAKRLNVIALGRDVCVNLGINHRFQIIYSLILLTILTAVSTALVGPLTFFGFLVAALTYQWVPTHDHRYLFPFALLLSYVVLMGAYFLMFHVFNAQGVVTILIELFGGLTFLLVILKRGSL